MSRAASVRFALTLAAAALAACNGRPAAPASPAPADTSATALTLTLHPDRPHQTIHSFGASDAWSIQFVGQGWPVAQRERIADLLFSLEEGPDGSPEGIGLSAWRFNIGAGSAAQGDTSGIRDPWRRAGSFLRPAAGAASSGDADDAAGHSPGTLFDPTGQPGQRWFLRAARDRGVEHFVGFVNSPPVQWTRNHRAHSAGGDASNLRRDRYDDFARYLRDVVVALEERDGVTLDQLSPANEPQWDWEGGQEGSPCLNEELRDVVVALSGALHEAGLETGISIPEAAKLTYLYEDADKPRRGEQAAAFFDPASPLYVGDLPNVDHEVAGHSYFTAWPADTLVGVRARLRDQLRAIDPELRFAMSEYCVLEDNPVIQGPGRDLGIETALWVARVIHADLTVADAAAWHWWLAVSPYDYKDGLVYIDRSETGGEIYPSKLLWALGHWSRFVRPGMRRIEVESSEPGFMASAFRHPGTGRTAVVVVNADAQPRTIRVLGVGPAHSSAEAPAGDDGTADAAALAADAAAVRVYLTSPEPGDDLRYMGERSSAETLVVPGRSLITLVSQ